MMLTEETQTIRMRIAKGICPRIYRNSSILGNITNATPRPMIQIAREHYRKTQLIGAEIGVAKALNALSILRSLQIKKLYLIDPYFGHITNMKLDVSEWSRHDKKNELKEAQDRLLSFHNVEWLIMTSEEAANKINEGLDFVYIDGNHSYEYVEKDLQLYYPLVKPNGLFGGHDYWETDVAKAVDEFVYKNNLKLNTLFPDWWVNKDDER